MVGSEFDTTSWSLVRAAGEDSSIEARQALEVLCQKYWHPVYAFIRRSGHDRDASQDLTQGFFTVLIERHYLLDADPARGKFRSFLLTAVRHFLSNERDRAHAAKRGGGHSPISIDIVDAEEWHAGATELETPERVYERRWALSVLQHVMTKLRAEFADAGKSAEFTKLSPLLVGNFESTHYETVAGELGVSAGAVRMAIHRLRRRYRALLRLEIAEIVSRPEDIEEELHTLRTILRVPIRRRAAGLE